jgi:hypothetical protein
MSKVLTGNHLGILGNCTAIPQRDDLNDKRVKGLLDLYKSDVVARNEGLHRYAKTLIEAGDIDKAWQALLVCTS